MNKHICTFPTLNSAFWESPVLVRFSSPVVYSSPPNKDSHQKGENKDNNFQEKPQLHSRVAEGETKQMFLDNV